MTDAQIELILSAIEKGINYAVDNTEQQIRELSKDIKSLKNRLTSIESWLAALSKGKDLHSSFAFAKDMTDLAERKNPTIQIGDKSESLIDCQ